MTAREEVLDILIDDKVDQLLGDRGFAQSVISNGFPGFSTMSNSELRQMVIDAGLDRRDCMPALLKKLGK